MKNRAVLMRMLVGSGIVSLLFLTGCGGGTIHSLNNQSPTGGQPSGSSGTNPVPAISSLDPSCAPVGGHDFTLTVSGSNFVSNSVVRWNGSNRRTTVADSSRLSAQISASDIAAAVTVAVAVFNPAPGGGSSAILPFAAGVGVSPQSIDVDPSGQFVYVANWGCPSAFAGSVSMYATNPTTGALTSIGPPVAAASGAHSVTVDPFGKFAYVANDYSKIVSMYTIDPTTGTLMPTGTISPRGRAVSVTVHPSGKFAYVGDGCTYSVNDSISMYTIDSTTGALTSIGAIPTGATGPSACSLNVGITIDPSGRFAYVAGDGCGLDTYSGYAAVYTISSTTGTLTSIGSPMIAGDCTGPVTIDPTDKFAYLPNRLDNRVSMYTIDATTGALTSIGTIAAGTGPNSVAVDPGCKFAYVTNYYANGVFGHDVSMYTINATSGVLTSIGTIAAGLGPSSVAIHPSGKFAYVTNSGSNDVSMYSIDGTTGALTLIGTIGT